MRQKRYSLLDKQSRLLKLLGIYMAVVLLIFAIVIPFLGPTDKEEAVQGTLLPDTKTPVAGTVPVVGPAITASSVTTASVSPMDDALETTKAQSPSSKQEVIEQSEVNLSKIIWPIKGEVSQKFGMVYSLTYSDYRFHNGIDIQVKRGSDIVAIMPGKVIKVETTKNNGTVIVVEHGTGWMSTYAHLEDSFIKVATTVKRGQVLGSVGQPGLSEVLDGPHLHLTLTKDGQAVNPLDYLPR